MNSRLDVRLARVKKRHKCKFVPRLLFMIVGWEKNGFTVIFKSKLALYKLGRFEKVLHNNDARKAANLNDPNFSILLWIIGVFR